MFADLFGKKRAKLGLHIHTTLSDGAMTPEKVAQLYRAAGYDAVALTDHWYFGESRELFGLPIFSGCEYEANGNRENTFHIVCLLAEREPQGITGESTPQEMVDAIHAAGGLAVLAHPAWSLNTVEAILAVDGFDATEIYNTVSGTGHSFRPDSSLVVDLLACQGRSYPLLATDDAHYYRDFNGMDACRSYIMALCDPGDPDSVKRAIREGDFYATQGPEIHLTKTENGFRVDCSPCRKIVFASNRPWRPRIFTGEDGALLCSAEYSPVEDETFLRAFVVDEDGKYAWTNIVWL